MNTIKLLVASLIIHSNSFAQVYEKVYTSDQSEFYQIERESNATISFNLGIDQMIENNLKSAGQNFFNAYLKTEDTNLKLKYQSYYFWTTLAASEVLDSTWILQTDVKYNSSQIYHYLKGVQLLMKKDLSTAKNEFEAASNLSSDWDASNISRDIVNYFINPGVKQQEELEAKLNYFAFDRNNAESSYYITIKRLQDKNYDDAVFLMAPFIMDALPPSFTGFEKIKSELHAVFGEIYTSNLVNKSDLSTDVLGSIYNSYIKVIDSDSNTWDSRYKDILNKEKQHPFYQNNLVWDYYNRLKQLPTEDINLAFENSITMELLLILVQVRTDFTKVNPNSYGFTQEKLTNEFAYIDTFKKDLDVRKNKQEATLQTDKAKLYIDLSKYFRKEIPTKSTISQEYIDNAIAMQKGLSEYLQFLPTNGYDDPQMIQKIQTEIDEVEKYKLVLIELEEQRKKEAIRLYRHSKRYVVVASLELPPLIPWFPKNSYDYEGQLDFRKQGHAHSLGYGIINGRYVSEQVIWKGTKYSYTFKKFVDDDMYAGFKAFYHVKKFDAMPGLDTSIVNNPIVSQVSSLNGISYGAAITVGSQMLGKLFSFEWYLGLGFKQTKFTATRSGQNVVFDSNNISTFYDNARYNTRSEDKIFNMSLEGGISIGLTNNWNRH
jgi:hypothetical protein